MSISLKDIELLKKNISEEVLAPKKENKPEKPDIKDIDNEKKEKKEKKITKIKKMTQLEQLQELSKKIQEMEEEAKGNKKKIKPIEIIEPVEVKKPVELPNVEEGKPENKEEIYNKKEDILKNPVELPTVPVTTMSQEIPKKIYKEQERINSIHPFNWGNTVQRNNITPQPFNINKYIKGRKF